MFSRCFPSTAGSGLGNALYRGARRLWRRWGRRCAQCVRSMSGRCTQVSAPIFDYHSPDYVVNMVDYLASAVQNEDQFSISTFLAIYPKFATIWEVLDMVMKRYPSFQRDCKQDQKDKRAIAFFLGLWIERLPLDFCESPDLAMLNRLKAYVSLNMSSSHLDVRVQLLLSLLEEEEGYKNQNPKQEEACSLGSSKKSSSLQALDDTSGMQNSGELGPALLAVPQGELPQQVVPPVNMEPVMPTPATPAPVAMEPSASVSAEPAPAITEPSISTTAKPAAPPPAMAADSPTGWQEVRFAFKSAESQSVCPLPDVDI